MILHKKKKCIRSGVDTISTCSDIWVGEEHLLLNKVKTVFEKQLAPCFILLLPKAVDTDAKCRVRPSFKPTAGEKAQAGATACLQPSCLTALSGHSQVSQINSVLLQVSH